MTTIKSDKIKAKIYADRKAKPKKKGPPKMLTTNVTQSDFGEPNKVQVLEPISTAQAILRVLDFKFAGIILHLKIFRQVRCRICSRHERLVEDQSKSLPVNGL